MGWLGYNSIVSLIVHIAVLIPLAMFTWATFEDAEEMGTWYSKSSLRRRKETVLEK